MKQFYTKPSFELSAFQVLNVLNASTDGVTENSGSIGDMLGTDWE